MLISNKLHSFRNFLLQIFCLCTLYVCIDTIKVFGDS